MSDILAAAEAICNTRFPPRVKLGSRVRRGHRPRPRPHSVDIPLWEERARKRRADALTFLCSCVGTQACFLGGLACVLGLSWECFCFVKLIHTPGPRSAGWQHRLPGLEDGKRQRNDVVMKLIPCWHPPSIVLKGVAWVLWKGHSVEVGENIFELFQSTLPSFYMRTTKTLILLMNEDSFGDVGTFCLDLTTSKAWLRVKTCFLRWG